ncbi:hypothetical protein SAMN05421774_11060 [Gemmobacter megaterium]|uniref:Uncharacterized protein n=1 Tax=Gemmobacter megaterium TaxID=1086013 RepID=A0A1N7QG25_9RHOB|nr:hypothetical protein [Gemmobacter megaterium]GGE25615.1 hypothetical protein GCM10011345_34440 [Gemmobacter megaterium]SIT21766.1 hypothetical protein SAMN05421774_11060 [Gemmobacter megaterium]
MKLVLHIGGSGTGGLQSWLAARRTELTAQGVCHPDIFGAADHAGLVQFALTRGQLEAMPPAARPFADAEAQNAFRKRLRARVAETVAQGTGVRAWLLSDADLFRSLHTDTMVDRVRDLLGAHFTEIAVFLHLRPQTGLIGAEALAMAQAGLPVSQATMAARMLGSEAAHLDADRLVARWEKVFGAENVHLVPHVREPAIAEHLMLALGVSPTPLGPLPAETEAPGWRALALANAVTQGGGQAMQAALPLADLPATEPLRPDAALAAELRARYDRGNAALIKRRPDLRAGDMEMATEGTATLPLVETPCLFAEQLVALVRRNAHDLTLERYARLLAESRQAIAEGRREDAAALLPALDALAARLSALADPQAGAEAAVAPPAPAPGPEAKAKPAKPKPKTKPAEGGTDKAAGKPAPKKPAAGA